MKGPIDSSPGASSSRPVSPTSVYRERRLPAGVDETRRWSLIGLLGTRELASRGLDGRAGAMAIWPSGSRPRLSAGKDSARALRVDSPGRRSSRLSSIDPGKMATATNPSFDHGAALRVPPAHDARNWARLCHWLGDAWRPLEAAGLVSVCTPGGWLTAGPGDWIILSAGGQFHVTCGREAG